MPRLTHFVTPGSGSGSFFVIPGSGSLFVIPGSDRESFRFAYDNT